MNCLDHILDALANNPARTVRLERRIFLAARLTIAGRKDLSVAKQLDLWARTHDLVCVSDVEEMQFTFAVKDRLTLPDP